MLVLVDDLSGYVWLEPALECTARVAAETILRWCVVFDPPRVFVSDTAHHFNSRFLSLLVDALGTEHHFSVTNAVWSNGTVERVNHEVIKTFEAVLNEANRPIREWPAAVPVVQWALNTAHWIRLGTTPYQLMFGGAPHTVFLLLTDTTEMSGG